MYLCIEIILQTLSPRPLRTVKQLLKHNDHKNQFFRTFIVL